VLAVVAQQILGDIEQVVAPSRRTGCRGGSCRLIWRIRSSARDLPGEGRWVTPGARAARGARYRCTIVISA